MLAYILHDNQQKFADLCAYSLAYHAPTVLIKTIDVSKLGLLPHKIQYSPLLLANTHNDWFLCCHSALLFLDDPTDVIEYSRPDKTVCKVARFDVLNSPLLLCNGMRGISVDADSINKTEEAVLNDCEWIKDAGDIPDKWVYTPGCSAPHSILFNDIVADSKYSDIWLGYCEALDECSAN